jgi:hypothetical protein
MTLPQVTMMMTGKNYLFINLLQDDSGGGLIAIGLGCAFVFLMFFLVRMFGAWMFRINDVIDELKKVNSKLSKMEKQLNKDSE